MLIQLQLLSSIRCSFIAHLLCRYVPAGSKSKGRCVKSLLCFLCFHWKCAVGFLHICMCYIGARPTRIVVKNPSFFSKIYLDS